MEEYMNKLKKPNSMVCGIAAMMAEKFDWSLKWTRIVWLIAAVMNPISVPVIYFVLALVLPKWKEQYR